MNAPAHDRLSRIESLVLCTAIGSLVLVIVAAFI